VALRVLITSRIFAPEPSAASFRLKALAEGFSRRGHQVRVLTAKGVAGSPQEAFDFEVSRWPVKRDRQGYVRGYVSYMSFDVPLFLRVLFSRRADLVVTEPPPTTGAAVRMACALRRIPYVYYAADVWSDAAAQTGAPEFVVNALRVVERWAWRGASIIASVSDAVTERLTELGVTGTVRTVGNGVDARALLSGLGSERPMNPPYFVYAGTASEVHGAGIFLEAFARAVHALADCRLVFIGGGVEREQLLANAEKLGVADRLDFLPMLPAPDVAPWLEHSVASLASVRPGLGYDFAFPTKLYSTAVCGARMIYTGPGPARDFVDVEVEGVPLGRGTDYDAGAVAKAMIEAFADAGEPLEMQKRRAAEVSEWAAANLSLDAVADAIVTAAEKTVLVRR